MFSTWLESLMEAEPERATMKDPMTRESEATVPAPAVAAHPTIARLYDRVLGDKNKYGNDRAVLAELLGILHKLRPAALANAAFVTRAVHAVAEPGVRQFLDLGCGLPKSSEVTVLAAVQQVQPQARVVYVDNDTQVAVHGRALLEVEGQAIMVAADARKAEFVLREAASLLDLHQPVAVIAAAVAHFWPDDDEPAAVSRRCAEALPAGGLLIFTHARGDLLPPDVLERAVAAYGEAAPIFPRTASQITAILDGFRLLEPGLVEASPVAPTARASGGRRQGALPRRSRRLRPGIDESSCAMTPPWQDADEPSAGGARTALLPSVRGAAGLPPRPVAGRQAGCTPREAPPVTPSPR
ncbi:SAM-dependent methyltransferase [Nonomuraea sp. NPDC050790]|uniref:SAM-dependent methyltransferase n=1 Tax=Nonomuraea sp. NPDC050790 TaxID=3364371 RepID=UPI0037B529E0